MATLVLVVGCLSTPAIASINDAPPHGATAPQLASEEAPATAVTTSVVRQRVGSVRRRFRAWVRRALGNGPGRRLSLQVLQLQYLLRPPDGCAPTVLRL